MTLAFVLERIEHLPLARLTTYFGEMVNHLIANVMKSDGDDETLEQRQIGK
jgi:hypothetical protein